MTKMRIGYGEDIHRLVPDRKLILGGIEIPSEKGLLGHSDADVLLHALSDALLGALALGDIGDYFPPSDPSIKGIDSRKILEKCLSLVRKRGYEIQNVDCSLTAEKPRLSPYRRKIRESLANLLETPLDEVSLKLMTNEGLDALGQGLAIKAVALVLLSKKE